ncbi:metal-dependent phosphohydrolase [Zoogloea sp. G-4-1-14]|uniref:Metal-dependent phosphohydrolase n=2 Tax=Zoogloea dura TaxID=2728840 RepID=A0A848GCX4_9RHOO|nr:metal-dependent phosphohydrolase [Zoogloea dura]
MHTPPARQRFRFPLHVHISTLFFLLVLVAGGSIAWASYARSARMLEGVAGDMLQRISRQTAAETGTLLEPVDASLRQLVLHPLARAGTLAERLAALPALREALLASPSLAAVYAGYGDGEFFLLLRLADAADRRLMNAPEGAAYLIQSIDDGQGRYVFLDRSLGVLRDDPRPDYPSSYDPRRRIWYTLARGTDLLVQTEPYLFASTRKPGVTLARRSVEGVVMGADIRLETLDGSLRRQRMTPASQLVIFEPDTQVVAFSEGDWLAAAGQGGGRPRLADLQGGVMAALAARLPRGGDVLPLVDFQAGGRDWHGAVARLVLPGGRKAFLGVAIPDDELLTEARGIRDQSLLVTLLVMLLALPFTYFAARLVSRPIRSLAEETAAIRRFDFADPVATRSVVREVDDLAADLASMKGAIRRFLDIASVTAGEADFDRLLARLVDETVAVVGARAGVLYLVRDGAEQLDPVTLRDAAADSLPLERAPDGEGMAGLVPAGASSGVGLLAADSPGLPGCGRLFERLGVGTMAYLAVPLLDRQHARLGLMVLWFDEAPHSDLVHFVEALSGSAAMSVETRGLIQAQKQLFEAFIQLIAGAIDAKSPYTGGHCARVPVLTKMLAQAACDAGDGPFRDFRLSAEDWEAVHIAAWLHDCGKVTTPEFVVDKATKLETIHDRIHEIRMRFEVLKRDAEIASLKALAAGEEPTAARQALEAEWARLDADFAFVAACNLGGEAIDPAAVTRLQAIARRTWLRTLDDRLGIAPEEARRKGPAAPLPVLEALLADRPEHLIPRGEKDRVPADNPWGFRMAVPELLYNRGELANLSVGRGTLTEEDRYKINEHIVQTIRMLSELPFPRHLKAVPEIAGGHHEKMDGSGYPRGLTREEMSPVARMMAIADIFEALTAVDRPYKRGKRLSEAMSLMARMRDHKHIDPELFELFVKSQVYRDYASRFMAPEYVDEVDEAALLRPPACG